MGDNRANFTSCVKGAEMTDEAPTPTAPTRTVVTRDRADQDGGQRGRSRAWLWITLLALLTVSGAAFVYFSEQNVNRYRVVRLGNRIVVFRGLYLPWGERQLTRYIPVLIPEEAEIKDVDTFGSMTFRTSDEAEYQLYKLRVQIATALLERTPDEMLPLAAALRRAHHVLLRAATLRNLSSRVQSELEGLQFKVLLRIARHHLGQVKVVKPAEWLGELTRGKLALYDALRLRHISDRQRELVDALLGDVYYLEGRVMLSQVTRQLIKARDRFRKAQRREALIYRDADRWVKFIDARLAQFADLDKPFRVQNERHLPLRVPVGPPVLSETPSGPRRAPAPKHEPRSPLEPTPAPKLGPAPKLDPTPAPKLGPAPKLDPTPVPKTIPAPKIVPAPKSSLSRTPAPMPKSPSSPTKSPATSPKN